MARQRNRRGTRAGDGTMSGVMTSPLVESAGGRNLADIPQNQACKYVTAEGVCERYQGHIQNNDYASANQEIQTFATQENITFQESNTLIQVCCGFRGGTGTNNGKCDEDLWVNMPNGVASGNQTWWGKANYCNRCAVNNNNSSGLASDGNLPAFLTSAAPYWNASQNGKNYCHCCEDDNTGDYTCETFKQISQQQQDGYCQKWKQAQGNPLAIQSEIQNLATILSISNSYAQWIFENCCDDCPPSDSNSPFYTTDNFCDSDWCVDGQGNPLPSAHPDCKCCPSNNNPCPPADPNSPFYTNPGEFCISCGPGQGYANHPDCQCCDNQADVLRYRCDAGGCLQCPPGTPASVCPHNESTCANSCGTSAPPIKRWGGQSRGAYYGMSGTKTNNWIPVLVLGLSLAVGIYISEYATKKIIK